MPRKPRTAKKARRDVEIHELALRIQDLREAAEAMNARSAEITRELELIFADQSNPGRIGAGIRHAETSGGNALTLAQDEKFAESDRLLEKMLAIPAVTSHGRRAKAVALLRHLENQRQVWPHKYPDSELARKVLLPLLQEIATAAPD
jgi:hypothetical protein